MNESEETERALHRVAGELSRIEYECLEVQEADNASTMAGLAPEDIKRRQILDRVTQEIAAIGEFVGALAKTGDVSQSLSSVGLNSIRLRLADEPIAAVDAGEPEIF